MLDATRCISYTTIESRGALPESLREAHGDWVFGCDVCQEVCPVEPARAAPRAAAIAQGLRARLAPREPWLRADASPGCSGSTRRAGARRRARTALRRARYRGLLRNALVAAGNSGDASLAPLLRRHAEGDDPLLAEHARWALARLGGRCQPARRAGAARPGARARAARPCVTPSQKRQHLERRKEPGQLAGLEQKRWIRRARSPAFFERIVKVS